MIPLALSHVAQITGGRTDTPDVVVTGPATNDSRAVTAGGLFAALPGTNVDGHDFAEAAVAAGAAAVLCSRPVSVPHVLVGDVTEALGALAAHGAARLSAHILGVTGSAGKTSVKDLIATIVEAVGPTVAPVGSYNNELGVPLTVLRADRQTEFLVVEMGARGPGHIARLCAMARPSVGVVVNVGHAHIGEFGTIDATASAKAELVESLPPDGVAVLNADDPRVLAMADRTAAPVLTWGSSDTADVRILGSEASAAGTTVILDHGGETATIRTMLIGDHVASNVGAAVAAAMGVGIRFSKATAVLAGAAARSAHRMALAVTDDGVTVLDDTFNANPEAMAAALRTLASLQRTARVAILGEMLEMGADGPGLHEAVGRLAAELGIEQLIAVGPGAAPIAAGYGPGAVAVPDVHAAVDIASASLTPGSVVLVKASRGARLERVVDGLLRRR